nr:putative reverse transcriptase domain-containing protein [Tanacetum cinerariifolium]
MKLLGPLNALPKEVRVVIREGVVPWLVMTDPLYFLIKQYIRPFKIVAKVRLVAYRLELLQKLSGVHNTFYVSNLKKCLLDKTLAIQLEEIQVDDKLHFVKEPVEIMDWKSKNKERSRIPIIKVRWNSNRGPEFTWELED